MILLISIFIIFMTTDSQSICDTDISPNSDTCLQLHTWQFCSEIWMIDQCCVTCGYISCLNTCYDSDINNVPSDRLTPYNCSSNISPNNNTCQEIASWGLCTESWVYAFCCSSCPEACRCNLINNVSSNTTDIPMTTTFCDSDISPNEVDTCLDFYIWGHCSDLWMVDKCCRTCGYISCLDSCYGGDINNVPPDRLTPFDCNSDISPNTDNTCSDFKQWGDCSAEWIQNQGYCCKSCPVACHCPSNTSDANTLTSTISIVHDVNCIQDIAPPAGLDGVQPSCLAQYRWDNCNAVWMKGYCCLTCGFESCLNVCYDGDVDNIAYSEYYPNPFDCRINEQPPPADGMSEQSTCTQQVDYGKCDEWWMYGYCCNVCPEACLCDEFNWNNNTFSEDGNDFEHGMYDRLSYEEIKFWEQMFIAMHCLLLFAILLIPIVVYGKKYYDKATDIMRIIVERVHTEPVECPAVEKRYGDNLTTFHLTMSTQTHCHVVTEDDDDEEPGIPSQPTKQRSDASFPEVHSVNLSPTISTNLSDDKSSLRNSAKSKSRDHDDEQEEQSKGLKYFKLLAFICVSLWILRILLEIISMSIWYNDTGLASRIAKPWDTFRMLVYIIPKTLMYLTLILRIYFCFKDSAYGYSIKFIIGLIMILSMDVIVRISVHIMVIYSFSGDIIDRNSNISDYNNEIFYGLIFLIIEEILFTLVLIIAFVKPLFVISKSVLTENIVDLMSKYVVLGYWCIISSFMISIFGIFYINTNDLFIIWTRTLLCSLDCVINAWCTILVFRNAMFWYKKICRLCHECIKLMYVTKFKSQGIELTKMK